MAAFINDALGLGHLFRPIEERVQQLGGDVRPRTRRDKLAETQAQLETPPQMVDDPSVHEFQTQVQPQVDPGFDPLGAGPRQGMSLLDQLRVRPRNIQEFDALQQGAGPQGTQFGVPPLQNLAAPKSLDPRPQQQGIAGSGALLPPGQVRRQDVRRSLQQARTSGSRLKQRRQALIARRSLLDRQRRAALGRATSDNRLRGTGGLV